MREFSVLVADGHGAYREGLARAIEAHSRLRLVAEVTDGRQALEELLALEPDIALLEVRMPKLDGLEVCDIVNGLDRPIATRIVLLTGEVNETLVAAAQAIGVATVLNKEAPRRQLCEELLRIAERGQSGA